METSKVEFYKVRTLEGMEKCIAGKSREAVLTYIGRPETPYSLAVLGGLIPDGLEQISEEEARRSRYFENFDKEGYPLCDDGTFDLGRLINRN